MPLMQDPPARVKARTNATGSLTTFTVDETAISPGYRSFTQAVADGDLASGTDIFPVIVIDATVTNGPKLFQIATATWNNTTKQLTIVTNYQPASPPSWGAGWRDVVVINLPALFLLLAGGTLTGVLKILLSGAIISPAAETGLVVQRSATASTEVGFSLISGTSGKSRLNMGDTADEDAGGIRYDNSTNTLHFVTNGLDRQVIDSSGVLKTAVSGGNTYDNFAGGGVTKVPFYMATAPALWTKDTTHNDKAMRVVSGTGGGSGGSRALSSATTGGTVLLIAHLPEHVHNGSQYVISSAGSYVIPIGGTGANVGFQPGTGTTGSDTAHDHPLALAHIDLIICGKN